MLQFEQMAPDVFLLKTPFGALWSGVFLIRGEKSILVDSGAGSDTVDRVIIPALEQLGVALESVAYVINTHAHGDHAHGNARLMERTGAKLVCIDKAVDKFRNPMFYSIETRAKYPAYSPKPPAFIPAQEPDIILHDGDVFENRIRVFETPGHDSECISILDLHTNSLMTGDSLQFGGTRSTAGCDIAYYKDLAGYRRTIERIRQIAPENLFASHDYQPAGSSFFGRAEVERALRICTETADSYTEWVGEMLRSGMTDLAEISRKLIHNGGGVEGAYLFTDMYTADEHIAEWKCRQGDHQ